ncbi:tail terminator [Arthrobacter phage Snek]|uniref:Tail terminator n=1 Tax=Arthrobacter phage Tweety19 TaxID=2768133 RepID=A0A7G9W210_9CAUD|nr:tail terminator [Arthrobacter phage Tweety19]QNO12673.1 tail terminator [Arthrobacter phage Tweety19]
MKAAVTFPDAQRAVRDLLRSLLSSRSEPSALGATVSTRGLEGSDESRPLPYVQVRSDGKFRDARLDGRATVRVLVYHRDVGLAEDLAALAEALLLSASNAEIRGSSSVAGPIPTDDDETGLPLSFFTITTRLVPRQL